jgi:hypothetical protein
MRHGQSSHPQTLHDFNLVRVMGARPKSGQFPPVHHAHPVAEVKCLPVR